MPLPTSLADPIGLSEDFDDVSLADSKARTLALPRAISMSEYSDSSTSSSSNSSRSSTNSTASTADDDYGLSAVDLNYVASAAAKHAFRNSSTSSSNRSSVTSGKSDDNDNSDDFPSASNFTDNEESEFPIAANKLNGYAINTLKSKSSISLLNPNQASAQSRELFANEPTALFTLQTNTSSSSLQSTNSPISPTPRQFPLSRRLSSKNSLSSLRSPTSPQLSTSPSLLVQASQASQGLRVKSFSASKTVPAALPSTSDVVDETDSFAPLPNTLRPLRKAISTPRLNTPDWNGPSRQRPQAQPQPRPTLRRSASSRTVNPANTPPLTLPSTRQGLTPQQRLRLRRQNSTSKLTVEQLELQCESDDGDDDIPADALVWNVPLSPALYAKAQVEHTKSARPKSAPVSKRGSLSTSSRSPDGLSSIKETEPTQYFNSTGLEHLSEDARNLTRAFQELPTAKAMEVALTKQHDQPSVKLPPKRRSNDFMDPVPISKEKDAVLSRTRPSWLPPKSQEEEARHLYEYQKMMAKATIADQQRESKKKAEESKRLKLRQQDELEWTTNILPRFERAVQEPKTRELWWRGIPIKYRALIWKARAGNTLGITKSTYEQALKGGREAIAKLNSQAELSETEQKQKQMFDLLSSSEALPELGLFGKNGPMHDQLIDILIAFAVYRPDIGYKSGLQHLAATFLLNLTPLESFTALASTLNHSLCQAIYVRDEHTLTSYYTSFLKVLHTKIPTLYEHFKGIRLPPSAYLEPMLTSLYSQHVSIDIATRIWDVMFFEGDSFLLRVALGILMKYEHKLYGSAQEILAILGWGAPKLSLGDEDAFISIVRSALKANNV